MIDSSTYIPCIGDQFTFFNRTLIVTGISYVQDQNLLDEGFTHLGELIDCNTGEEDYLYFPERMCIFMDTIEMSMDT